MGRFADRPRGPEKFPHWHDSLEWAKRTTMTRQRLIAMTPAAFADWCFGGGPEVDGFFFAYKWPEAHSYRTNRAHMAHLHGTFADPQRIHAWPSALLTEEELKLAAQSVCDEDRRIPVGE